MRGFISFSVMVGLIGHILGIFGCNMDPAGPCLLLVAPGNQVSAKVLIDGEEVGILDRQTMAGTIADEVFPKPDFVPREIVSLSIDVSNLPEGDHVVQVVNEGRVLINETFSVPLVENELFYAWSNEEEPQ